MAAAGGAAPPPPAEPAAGRRSATHAESHVAPPVRPPLRPDHLGTPVPAFRPLLLMQAGGRRRAALVGWAWSCVGRPATGGKLTRVQRADGHHAMNERTNRTSTLEHGRCAGREADHVHRGPAATALVGSSGRLCVPGCRPHNQTDHASLSLWQTGGGTVPGLADEDDWRRMRVRAACLPPPHLWPPRPCCNVMNDCGGAWLLRPPAVGYRLFPYVRRLQTAPPPDTRHDAVFVVATL